MQKKLTALAALLVTLPVYSQTQNINISAILNAGFTDRGHEFEGIGGLPVDGEHAAGPQDGFWLDHTELAFSGAVDNHFYGKLTTVLAEHDGATEVELEEAFIQTLSMPYGLSVRAGRFLSNLGYLNSKHAHTDYFVARPLAYRGLLSSHYYDDGVRLNWVAPTDLYLEAGVEAFKGAKFPANSEKSIGSKVVYLKSGADLSESVSWQAGLSWLTTENDLGFCSSHNHADEHAHEGDDHGDDGHDEEHSFGEELCEANGEKEYWVADFTMKWAPGGNYKYQSLTWQTEWIEQEISGQMPHHDDDDHDAHDDDDSDHDAEEWEAFKTDQSGWYSSLVYQWSPNWSAGVRYSQIEMDKEFGEYKPKALDAMIQYQFSHFSNVRLQWTQDKSTDEHSDDVISLQYTMAIGDHGAHQF